MMMQAPNGLGGATMQSRAATTKLQMSATTAEKSGALSWEELSQLVESRGYQVPDVVNGPTNSQSRLRLFGQEEKDVRVTLYRDHHAWCPYC